MADTKRANNKCIPIRVSVNLLESPQGEKPPKAAAYAFTSNGRFLASAEIDGKGNATLEVPVRQTAEDIRVVIGPDLQNQKVDFSELSRRGAQQSFVRVSPDIKELTTHFQIMPEKWRCWLRLCLVKGTVLKRILSGGVAIDYPVCGAQVQIYDVDPIYLIIAKLSDVQLLHIKEYILYAEPLPRPPIPRPDPPEIHANYGLMQFAKPMTTVPEFTSDSAEFDSLHTAAVSGSLTKLRQALARIDESALRFLICRLFPRFIIKHLLATVTTDRCGHFETYVVLGCHDRPDLYFTASVHFGPFQIPIYEPTPVSCYTHWNYECGTEVTLYTSSPFAPLCAPCAPVDAPENYVLIRALGNVQLNKIYGTSTTLTKTPDNEGLVADLYWSGMDSPFGGLVLPRIEFDSSLRANNIAKYYRVRYRLGTSGSFTDLTGPISRKYNHFVGTDLITSVYPLGPVPVGSYPYLFEIPPAVPPAGDWCYPDPPRDLANAQFPTTDLPSPISGGTYGKYQLLVELFDSAGNPVDIAAAGIGYFVPTIEDPDGTIHTQNAATLGLVSGNAFIMTVQVDNRPTVGSLPNPSLDGTSADTCGAFRYSAGMLGTVNLPYAAAQPGNFARYQYRLSRGVTPVTGTPIVGQVSSATNPATLSMSVVSLLTLPDGTVCDVGGFAEDLYVWSAATDGWNRLYSYDSNPQPVGFALAPQKP
jgi:hypothetical protein